MATTRTRARVEEVLLETASLLVERARREIEREIEAAPDSDAAAADLRRVGELEGELREIQRELRDDARATELSARGRVVSRFYEVPGQEDA
jgi:Mg2+ and Co2+ transporter CorA